jgi:hypothetical protein
MVAATFLVMGPQIQAAQGKRSLQNDRVHSQTFFFFAILRLVGIMHRKVVHITANLSEKASQSLLKIGGEIHTQGYHFGGSNGKVQGAAGVLDPPSASGRDLSILVTC